MSLALSPLGNDIDGHELKQETFGVCGKQTWKSKELDGTRDSRH